MTHKGTDCSTCPYKRDKYPYCIDKFVEEYGKDCFELKLTIKEKKNYGIKRVSSKGHDNVHG